MRSPDVAAEILAYLDAHPHAVDSTCGIARAWLSKGPYDVADVQEALDVLTEDGVLERILLANGKTVYGRLVLDRL